MNWQHSLQGNNRNKRNVYKNHKIIKLNNVICLIATIVVMFYFTEQIALSIFFAYHSSTKLPLLFPILFFPYNLKQK